MGSYGFLQRAKSYAEVARLLGRTRNGVGGLYSAVALTDDFVSAVVYGKRDVEQIPKMQSLGLHDQSPRTDAVAGMQALSKDVIALDPPDLRELEVMQAKIRTLYELAYTWKPPVTECARVSTSSRIRQHIKSWITSWDISRLCGVGDVGIQTEEMTSDYTENQPANEEDVMDELLKALTHS